MDRVGEVLRRRMFRQPVDSRAPAGILRSSPQLIRAAMNAQATPIVQQSELDNLSSLAAAAPAAQPTQIETPPGSGVGVVGVDTPPPQPGGPGGPGVVGGGGGTVDPSLTTEPVEGAGAGTGTGPTLAQLIAAASDSTTDDTSSETSDDTPPVRPRQAGSSTAGSTALNQLLNINERMKEAGTKAEKKKAANEARELLTEMGIDAKDIRTDKNLNLMMFGLTLASTPGSLREGVVEAGKQTLSSFAAGKAAEQKGQRELDLAAVKMGTADVTAAQSRLSKRAEQLTEIVKEEIKAQKLPEKLQIANALMTEDPNLSLREAIGQVNASVGGFNSQVYKRLMEQYPDANPAVLGLIAGNAQLQSDLAYEGSALIETLEAALGGTDTNLSDDQSDSTGTGTTDLTER